MEIKIKCAECNTILEGWVTADELFIAPCDKCLDKAGDDGYGQGYAEAIGDKGETKC